MLKYGLSPRFVDDKCFVLDKSMSIHDCIKSATEVANILNITIHPNKIYIQPSYHGVNFCGRTVKGDRIYLSNSTINRAFNKVYKTKPTLPNAIKICNIINSYLGLLRHCTEYKNQQRLCDVVLKCFGKWLNIRKKMIIIYVR